MYTFWQVLWSSKTVSGIVQFNLQGLGWRSVFSFLLIKIWKELKKCVAISPGTDTFFFESVCWSGLVVRTEPFEKGTDTIMTHSVQGLKHTFPRPKHWICQHYLGNWLRATLSNFTESQNIQQMCGHHKTSAVYTYLFWYYF